MSKLFLINFLLFLVVYNDISFGLSDEHNKWVKESIEKNINRLTPNSLNRFGWSKYSQYGEDGILEEIFKRLEINNGFFVEFGARDGISCSNTRYLLEKGWHGVLIETDDTSFAQLQKNYENKPDVLSLKFFVTWKKSDERGKFFEEIREEFFSNREIDFLSIDIDGCDFYIFKTLTCRPKVICIENGLKWHPLFIEEVPEDVAKNNLHQPIQVVLEFARAIGYEPLCSTNNLIFIRRDFYNLFPGMPTDAITLWKDAFRALPNKQYWLDCREFAYPDIKKYERNRFVDEMPINLES